MKSLLLAAILAFATDAAIAHEYKAGSLEIKHPWARATPKGAAVAGGYMTIINKGTAPDRLIGFSSPAAGKFEIHEMTMDNGVMKMRPVTNGVEIKPGQTVELKPGSYHLMFMGLKQPFEKGKRVKGTLEFEKAGKVEVEYAVEAIGATAPSEDTATCIRATEPRRTPGPPHGRQQRRMARRIGRRRAALREARRMRQAPARPFKRGFVMLRRIVTSIAVAALSGMTASAASAQKDIRWGTPPVGTSGHKAMVALSNILNKEMPKYRISVLPTAGAIATVKGFATNELDGFYGSDIAFHELATDTNRFKGFKDARQAPADAVVLVEYDRSQPRGSRPQQGQDQEMGRSRRQARVHRPAAVRRARPYRARRSPRSASSSPTSRSISRPSDRSSSPARSTPC